MFNEREDKFSDVWLFSFTDNVSAFDGDIPLF